MEKKQPTEVVSKNFLKISQNSQENTCAEVSISINLLAALKKETPAQMFYCEFCEIFKSTMLKNTSVRLLLDRM